jgi:hypothetical protein
MRRWVATTRITLQADKLPSTAERTELNYRTCVTTPLQDAKTTARLVSIVTLAFIAVGFGLRLLSNSRPLECVSSWLPHFDSDTMIGHPPQVEKEMR